MVSTTGATAGANTAGIDASRRADEAAQRNTRDAAEAGSSAPEVREAETPAVVYDGKIAELRRAEEAAAVQATRSPNASAVMPSARLFDITV